MNRRLYSEIRFVVSLIHTALERLRAGEPPAATGKVYAAEGSLNVTIEFVPNPPPPEPTDWGTVITCFDEIQFSDLPKLKLKGKIWISTPSK